MTLYHTEAGIVLYLNPEYLQLAVHRLGLTREMAS
jgi:hypothetical protein